MFTVVRKSEIDRLKAELHQAQTFPCGVDYEVLRARAETAEQELASLKTAPLLHCSFCRKNHTEVEKLFAGPAVFICNECTELCMHIILDDKIAAREKQS